MVDDEHDHLKTSYLKFQLVEWLLGALSKEGIMAEFPFFVHDLVAGWWDRGLQLDRILKVKIKQKITQNLDTR